MTTCFIPLAKEKLDGLVGLAFTNSASVGARPLPPLMGT